MGGDFNASVYRYFASTRSRQRCPSLADSSLRQVLSSMTNVVNNELQTQCGGSDTSWMGQVFQYQIICANSKDTIDKYDNAVRTARNEMKDRRDKGEVIVPAHQTRILQDAIDELGCDTMA
eukprot:5666491-Amphidinium_carterae.1